MLLLPCLIFAPACGALAAAANPRTIWAVQEQAPLVVVVDRADAAQQTAEQVDRLLTATETRTQWPEHLDPTAEQVRQIQDHEAARLIYDGQRYKIVSSLVWARALSKIESQEPSAPVDEVKPEPSSAASPAPQPQPELTADVSAAPVSVPAAEQDATPPGDPSVTPATAALPVVEQAPAVPVPRSLFAAISPALDEGYAKLTEAISKIDQIDAQIEAERNACNVPGTSDLERKAHEATVELKKKELGRAKDAVEPARRTFVALCKAVALKAPPDIRARFGHALVSLRQAVDDAEIANSASVVAYPFAVKDLKNQLILSAKASAADYILEKTGKALDIKGCTVTATFDGKKAGVAINGIAPGDLGKISLDELVGETVVRTGKFAEKSLALLATVSSTKERLEFEEQVLDALLDGFKNAGWSAPSPTSVPDQDAMAIRASARAGSSGAKWLDFSRKK
jgi:hypothetical protein